MTEAVAELETPPAVDYGPIGAQIDALFDLRERKRDLEAQVTALNVTIDDKEKILFDAMDAQVTSKGAGRRASVSIGESVVPQVVDWDKYWAFIRRHNAFELLERRPAVAAYREHAAKRRDGTVPGAVPFTKRKLTLRTL